MTSIIRGNDNFDTAIRGKVLQVVQTQYTSNVTTTSTTLVDTPLTASITPSSVTSRVLVVLAGGTLTTAGTSASPFSLISLSRGATVITPAIHGLGYAQSTGSWGASIMSGSVLDSPASIAPVTYKIQFRVGTTGDTAYFNANGTVTLTLMEIAA